MSIPRLSRQIARRLAETGHKVVFAESCTGGLVSGALTRVPGISEHHCGGVVVYRNATKQAYLGISAALLDDPGPVSREVAELMAQRVLERTLEATIAVSVTGHLGPNAPRELDGRVFVGVAKRGGASRVQALRCRRNDTRLVRQKWVVHQALELLIGELQG
jgi:PncC family amidohydrolase